jgi:A/G-specific adenine glycosylase
MAESEIAIVTHISKKDSLVLRFRRTVWNFYKKSGRHTLPWRKTHDPYKILVSEVMLQQTQVERVIPFYRTLIKKFPTARKLATASLADVLQSWQGLGYNRRAKMLRDAARVVVANFDSKFPKSVSDLESLPGIGPYTARAVAAFAFNEPTIVIETNIRTAVIHHFFSRKKTVSDKEIEAVLADVLPKGKSREWYSALMDYGASLKRSGVSHNTRTAAYVKQAKFSGSLREARGVVLRELSKGAAPFSKLIGQFGATRRAQMRQALKALESEDMIAKSGKNYSLPER